MIMAAATALTAISGWDPASRTLTSASVWYSLQLNADARAVTVHNTSAAAVRYRVTDTPDDADTADYFVIPAASYVDILLTARVHGAPRVLHFRPDAASAVLRVTPVDGGAS